MRLLVLLAALVSMPTLAADRTTRGEPAIACQGELAQAPGSPGRYCCVHCRHNEIPCGRGCVAKPRNFTGDPQKLCKERSGCACPGKP